MDYIAFCKNYFAVTGLPVNLVNNDEILYSSLSDLLHIQAVNPTKIWPQDHNPEFRCLSSDIVYGSVQIENTGLYSDSDPCAVLPAPGVFTSVPESERNIGFRITGTESTPNAPAKRKAHQIHYGKHGK